MLNILLALLNGEKHGYAIMTEISEITNGHFKVGPATLYRTIRHMVQGGIVEESSERPAPDLDDERRRYYKITGTGRALVHAELNRLDALIRYGRGKEKSDTVTDPLGSS